MSDAIGDWSDVASAERVARNEIEVRGRCRALGSGDGERGSEGGV
jgi:hypothetical protein